MGTGAATKSPRSTNQRIPSDRSSGSGSSRSSRPYNRPLCIPRPKTSRIARVAIGGVVDRACRTRFPACSTATIGRITRVATQGGRTANATRSTSYELLSKSWPMGLLRPKIGRRTRVAVRGAASRPLDPLASRFRPRFPPPRTCILSARPPPPCEPRPLPDSLSRAPWIEFPRMKSRRGVYPLRGLVQLGYTLSAPGLPVPSSEPAAGADKIKPYTLDAQPLEIDPLTRIGEPQPAGADVLGTG